MTFTPARSSLFGPYDGLPGYDQAPGRVHELSHLDLTGLVAPYQRMYQDKHGSPPIPRRARNRDQVIRLVRDLEAPQPTPGDHAGY